MDTSIKGKSVRFDDPYLVVELEDGRVISTPLDWYPELQRASGEQRAQWKFFGRGTAIEWSALDVQLSIESMLQGVPIRVLHAVGH